MSSDEVLIQEEAYYWHTIAKAAELYEQFGDKVIKDIEKYVNKCRCKRIGSSSCGIS